MLAQLGIPAQRRDSGRVHRYPSSLVVLGLADHDHTGVQVDIIDVETDGLAHPHAGHGHQPEKRVIRRGGQRPWPLRCHRQQPSDVGIGHHVGRGAAAPIDQQIAGRHRHCGVQAVQIAGESSHHRQSLLPPTRLHALRCGGPLQGGVDGRCRGPDALEVVDERRQQPTMVVQLETQRASNPQIFLDVGAQLAAHRPPPGHERATTRRAARSSLA